MTNEHFLESLNEARKHSVLPVHENLLIPRVIHQTFMSKNLPVELKVNVENIQRLNPGWSHIIYDDAGIKEFIRENYGLDILNHFERINPKYGAARADLFRYLLMYKCGGVYLDIKSTCTRPLDEILKPDDKYILSQWRNTPGEPYAGFGISKEVAHIPGGEYQQWHIITVLGHPFLKAVIEKVLGNIERYRPWVHGSGRRAVLQLTGPIPYTLAIHPLLPTSKYRIVNNETVAGLQYSVFKPKLHQAIFKTHYSQLTEPIVKMKGLNKLKAYLFHLAKTSKHSLFK